MKVCFLSLTHAFDDTRVLHKEAHALHAAGYKVMHLAPGDVDRDQTRDFLTPDGIWIRVYHRGGRFSRLWCLFSNARAIRAACYHCNEVESWLVGLLLKLLRPSARVIFDVHEHYPSRFLEPHMPRSLRWVGPPLMRLLLKTLPWVTDYVILAKRSVAADFPVRFRRIGYIFNYGVMRIKVPERHEIPDAVKSHFTAPFTAVHIGPLSRARGWPQLVDALALVRNEVRVVCLGPVVEGVALLKEHARSRGVLDRVTILERVPYTQMFAYLSLANVGLMLYQPGIRNHEYAFPMKMYDYMRAGLPCIGPGFAIEVRPIVESERCGICIDTSSAPELAAALDRLASNPREAREMGDRGSAAIAKTYNWESEAARLVHVYREILGLPPGSKPHQMRGGGVSRELDPLG